MSPPSCVTSVRRRSSTPTVTQTVSAPAAGTPIPAQGAQATPPITFNVPKGVDRLNADMIWPDPTNSNILYYILTDPKGRLTEVSYDSEPAGPVLRFRTSGTPK